MTIPGGLAQVLQKEQDELHAYSRHNLQVYMAWFTFFITTNFIAMGLVVSQVAKNDARAVTIVVIVGVFFCLQNILAVGGARLVKRMYSAIDVRLEELVAELMSPNTPSSWRPRVHTIVIHTYIRAVDLMERTLKSMIVCWVLIMIAAAYMVLRTH